MMTPKEVLLRGKKRLERGWCQGAPARDANGEPVRPGSRSACSFCLVGAASYNISAAIEWSAWTKIHAVLAEKGIHSTLPDYLWERFHAGARQAFPTHYREGRHTAYGLVYTRATRPLIDPRTVLMVRRSEGMSMKLAKQLLTGER